MSKTNKSVSREGKENQVNMKESTIATKAMKAKKMPLLNRHVMLHKKKSGLNSKKACPFKSPTDSFMSPVTKALMGKRKGRRSSSNNLLKAASKKAHAKFLLAQAQMEANKAKTETK
eukprot:g3537.t1